MTARAKARVVLTVEVDIPNLWNEESTTLEYAFQDAQERAVDRVRAVLTGYSGVRVAERPTVVQIVVEEA